MKNESISTKKIVMTAFFAAIICRNTISAFRTHFRNACSTNAWT